MMISAESAKFDAELRPSSPDRTLVFVSGNLNAYDLECLRDAATYGVKYVRIRLSGVDLDNACSFLEGWLRQIARQGAEISVEGVVAGNHAGNERRMAGLRSV